MFPLFRPALLAASVLLACLPASAADSPVPIPVEHFFAEADVSSVKLSPDGTRIAFLTTLGHGNVGIALMDLATGKIEALVDSAGESIDFFHWKGPDRIIYGGDTGGNERYTLLTITLSTRHVEDVFDKKIDGVRRSDWAMGWGLLDARPDDPDSILVMIGGIGLLDLKRSKFTRNASLELKNETGDFEADRTGIVRFRSRYEGDRVFYELRDGVGKPFKPIANFPINDPRWQAISFNADNRQLYLISNEHHDRGALFAYDTATRTLGEPLFVPPAGEITSLIVPADHRSVYGVRYLDDRPRVHWFDARYARIQEQVDASLGRDSCNEIIQFSPDETLLLIYSYSDRNPGTYYLLDRRVPRLSPIGKVNRRLDPSRMQPTEPIQFSARDGLVIHGYLTRPANSAGRRVPMVVHPHGGPFGLRDGWGFDPEVQFLASRGYAVLQINFRGSGGYGYEFLQAGRREWGGKMQNDLTDGVKWAIAEGVADPERIAIAGASYGGYAALVGITQTPELYRCAINYSGVADLQQQTSWGRSSARDTRLYFDTWIGEGRGFLAERSPINFIDRIRVPTLHAYGSSDTRVEIEQWKRLEAKLKKFNKPYEIVLEEAQGHGFDRESTRIPFYRHVETFLAKNLLPPAAPAADASAKSSN